MNAEDTDRFLTLIYQKLGKENVSVQSAESMTERKLTLLGIVGKAQCILSPVLTLEVKRDMFGSRKLNDLETWELTRLITRLRKVYLDTKKHKKR